MDLISTATTTDEATRAAGTAVLPIGSFEQHGPYLPLATDTVIACVITDALARAFPLLQLPPVTISCSHEHTGWAGTVSIRAQTLTALIDDIAASLHAAGVPRLVLVNAHGGNYALANIVQQANVDHPRMALYPTRTAWETARTAAGLASSGHDDMHAGEIETSILLHTHPHLVRDGYEHGDHLADRPHLHTLGMRAYTTTGIIGQPSLATAAKGKAVLDSLTTSFADIIKILH